MRTTRWWPRTLLLGVTATAMVAGGARLARGSDHQDTAEVELNPRLDMTDVYAFPGSAPGRIALVMNSRAFLTPAQTPGASFDPNVLYQFKVDNTGDAKEDRVIQVSFIGEGANQQVQVRGPIAPPVQGAMMNTLSGSAPVVQGAINAPIGSANGMQVFAGPRADPFFIDLEAAFCILPDRKPVTGELAQPCRLPARPSAPFFFRPAGQAVDYVRGFNVLSIVIELPSSMLEAAAPGKLGIWGTMSR
ncbi:MAG: DUF4331 family protein [Gemmatimonadales bacterium]|nr:DUF4331 family protein [Gemmatimonadales bacterium]